MSSSDQVPDRSGVFSPAVRRLATVHGVDPRAVRGTGHGGRVTRNDLITQVAAGDRARSVRTAAIEVDLEVCRRLQDEVAREATGAGGPVLDDAALLARAVAAADPTQAPGRIAVLGSTPHGIFTAPRAVDAPHVAVVTIEGVRRRPVAVASGELEGIAVHSVGFVTITWIESAFAEGAVFEFLERLRIELEHPG